MDQVRETVALARSDSSKEFNRHLLVVTLCSASFTRILDYSNHLHGLTRKHFAAVEQQIDTSADCNEFILQLVVEHIVKLIHSV